MQREAFLEDGEREADVLDDEGVESDWSVVDVAKSHRESVDEEEEGVASVEPVGAQASEHRRACENVRLTSGRR